MNQSILVEPTGLPTEINRDLAKLFPPFNDMIQALLSMCHQQGLYLYVFEGRRSFARQHYLYGSGRTRPGKILTNADSGLSAHQYGLAVDLVFDGKPFEPGMQWTWEGDYQKLGDLIDKDFSILEWAGDWTGTLKEFPHVQLTANMQLQHIKALYDATLLTKDRSAAVLEVWNEVAKACQLDWKPTWSL